MYQICPRRHMSWIRPQTGVETPFHHALLITTVNLVVDWLRRTASHRYKRENTRALFRLSESFVNARRNRDPKVAGNPSLHNQRVSIGREGHIPECLPFRRHVPAIQRNQRLVISEIRTGGFDGDRSALAGNQADVVFAVVNR